MPEIHIPRSLVPLLCDDLDHPFLSQFPWRLVDRGRSPAHIRATLRGWVFYPHHLVVWRSLGNEPAEVDPATLYTLLAPVRLCRLVYANHSRFDVRRANLLVGSGLIQVPPADPLPLQGLPTTSNLPQPGSNIPTFEPSTTPDDPFRPL